MHPKIIAICGEKYHGKSTAAQALIGQGFHPINFADPVKEVCALVFGLSHEEMNDPDLKEGEVDRWPWLSPRHMMQKVGTELFRDWIDDTWIACWERKAKQTPFVVTADLRFPNEADAVRFHQGVIVRVVDPRKPLGQDQHISESGQSRITPHFTVVNDGTVAQLHSKMQGIGMLVLGHNQ